jgi:sulfur-oxidizing protein SoxY
MCGPPKQPLRPPRHRLLASIRLGHEDAREMTLTKQSRAVSRRAFALGSTAAVAAATLPTALLAQDQQQAWEELVKKVLGDAKPVEGKVAIEMPEIAENGNTVPFVISVDSPMTEKDFVKAIHVIATANPQPGVATFRFSPLSGKAAVTSRMRLARTQDIIAIAELPDGRFLSGKRNVKVTIGGCGG